MDGSRVSISIYRTDSAGGETVPKYFLPDGNKFYLTYTGDYFRRHGSADGSTISMAKNGHMALEAWEELTPNIVKGIRNLPII